MRMPEDSNYSFVKLIVPDTPELRREQIKLQVAVITPLMYVKGYGAPETKTARELNSLTFRRLELTLMSIDAVTCGK